MYYGAYKKSRNASWQCLIDNNISELPVSLTRIANNSNIKIIKNSIAAELKANEIGASKLMGSEWFIFYDDSQNKGRCRFTIAHELGHFYLGHLLISGRNARTFDLNRPQVEQDADIFASRLLAPACVIWGLNLKTPKQIADFCQISMSAAEIRAERMERLYKRNNFLTSELEHQVYSNFKDFIVKNQIKD